MKGGEITITLDIPDPSKPVFFLGDPSNPSNPYHFSYDDIHDSNSELLLDDKTSIPFSKSYKFPSQGEHTIKISLKKKLKSCRCMFSGCVNIKSVDLSKFIGSDVESMEFMFVGCAGLKNVCFQGVDTNNVKSMANMFVYCQELESCDLSMLKTENLESMRDIFRGCVKLRDVRIFDTSNVKDYACPFNSPFAM